MAGELAARPHQRRRFRCSACTNGGHGGSSAHRPKPPPGQPAGGESEPLPCWHRAEPSRQKRRQHHAGRLREHEAAKNARVAVQAGQGLRIPPGKAALRGSYQNDGARADKKEHRNDEDGHEDWPETQRRTHRSFSLHAFMAAPRGERTSQGHSRLATWECGPCVLSSRPQRVRAQARARAGHEPRPQASKAVSRVANALAMRLANVGDHSRRLRARAPRRGCTPLACALLLRRPAAPVYSVRTRRVPRPALDSTDGLESACQSC